MTTQINAAEFQSKVLEAEGPVLVDFFATWCGPCQMMAPVLDEASEEIAGKGAIYKIDVDQAPEIASQYGIMSIPTMILFQGGQPAQQFVGVQSKQTVVGLFA